jgi:XTP/dITP diphosphohydrolase
VAPWGEEAVVEGTAEGVLTDAPRGPHGFGYDPIFLIPALARTFGELSGPDKARLSHRARAVAAARPILARWAARLRQRD